MRAAMSFSPDSHFGAKAHEDALYISKLAVALSCGWFKPAFQFEISAAGVQVDCSSLYGSFAPKLCLRDRETR